jgi:hypothetical protein
MLSTKTEEELLKTIIWFLIRKIIDNS